MSAEILGSYLVSEHPDVGADRVDGGQDDVGLHGWWDGLLMVLVGWWRCGSRCGTWCLGL